MASGVAIRDKVGNLLGRALKSASNNQTCLLENLGLITPKELMLAQP